LVGPPGKGKKERRKAQGAGECIFIEALSKMFAYQSLFVGPFLFANGHSFDAGAVLLIVRATVVL
jgi:hypothetical protein